MFTSYELGRVLEHVAAAAREHPKAPGLQALRAASAARLTWDQYWPDCWADPDFMQRYLLLRTHLADAAGEQVHTTELLPHLQALLDAALALDSRGF